MKPQNFNNPADLADHLKAASAKYHGVVLHEYLKRLVSEMNDPEQRAARLRWIVEAQTKFMTFAVPPTASGQVHRVAKRFALVAAGGELASLYGLTGWKPGEVIDATLICFNSWLQRRGTAGQGEVEQLLKQVEAYFERFGDSRFQLYDQQRNSVKRTFQLVLY